MDADVEKTLQETGERMLQFFKYEHLPEPLRDTSASFAYLAVLVTMRLPKNPERTACLRKLLEAKDCAVRAKLEG